MAHSNESDFLIIGGGIAGTATAFHLAQHGKRVTLLERGRIAGEASGVNAGGLAQIHRLRWVRPLSGGSGARKQWWNGCSETRAG
ncbi:MAG: FAD-dependent oxidoreductase, partial [Chloroflexi bacterium]|nr:FAD-dependent oxidoreductase [Chloroflexota bacterium]